jgi:ribonuclease Y
MDLFLKIGLPLITCGIGIAIGYGLRVILLRARRAEAQKGAEAILSQAEREAENIRKEAELKAREEMFRRREEIDRELEASRKEIRDHERRVQRLEDSIEQKLDLIGKKEKTLESSQRKLSERTEEMERRNHELGELLSRQNETLQRISGMTQDQARQVLMQRLESQLSEEIGVRLQQHESRMKEMCEQKAREILATAIQRYAGPHTAETTTSTVDIPNDEMKGRIIGREGRNIRAFEKATGVDVIVDDTPGVVIVSGFDNVRREVARMALTKLIQDGRIHPSRIEEVVGITQKEMEEHIRKAGRQAAQEAGVPGLHEKFIELLGRLKFRTSYSQNVLQHSIEVAHLTGMMAEEMGLDGTIGRRCGLLHDIGKAADHEMEGGHPQIGADLARRFRERPEVIHAIGGHHDDVRIDMIYTVLVATADAISAARPGARRETLEKYVKRLEELEAVASGFPGVEQAFAIQAGREVRVIADAGKTGDKEASKMCRDIAKAIEEQLTYPGEIKVTVIRETRSVEFAR